jgi:glycosyltransferase involved in cell wall biosynthesis
MAKRCREIRFMKVLCLTRYNRLGPSSRLRSWQYVPFLGREGIEVDVSCLFENSYVSALYSGSGRWRPVLAGYLRRISVLRSARRYDLVWLEKEFLPWIPAALAQRFVPMGVPIVADYDDAVFHRYDLHRNPLIRAALGQSIDFVMRNASLVTAGNRYLADHAVSAGAKRVELLPTVIDLDRYHVAAPLDRPEVTVGWIGSPSTQGYLTLLAPVLAALQQKYRLRVVTIGANSPNLSGVALQAKTWAEDTEVDDLADFDIGVMPLPDEPWERGKCGYKLIQYMACGKPVVASPVGVNCEIVSHGSSGFLASTTEEWHQALTTLITDADLRCRMGAAARQRVVEQYCLQISAPKLASWFRQLVLSNGARR